MFKTKTSYNLVILRFFSAVAIVLFSSEITSPLFVSDDLQTEIVDIDLEDDTELDDENEILGVIYLSVSSLLTETKTHTILSNVYRIDSKHLEELLSPPPEQD